MDVSDLSQIEKAEIALQVAKKQGNTDITADGIITTMSKFGGIGRETGEAVKYALEGVVGVAEKFSGTNVGKITIALVIWRVVGVDIVLLFLGIVCMFLAVIVAYIFYKRPIERITFEKETLFWGAMTRRVPKEIVYGNRSDDNIFWTAIALIAGVFIFVFSLANIG